MKTIKNFSYTFEEKEPIIFLNPGEIVKLKIKDCFSGMIKKESDWPNEEIMKFANPCTGPIHINGAEPGMTLVCEIIDLKVGNRGTNIAREWGMIKGKVSGIRIMKIKDQVLIVNEKIKIPVNLMIGCIGVAPKNPVSTLKAGYFGGNMDITFIRKGSVVNLPVFIKGGLLYLGDLHALMGEGEPTLCAIETYGEVTIKVDLIPKNIQRPRIETEKEFITVAVEKDMETATKVAVNNMFEYLTTELGMDKMDAHVLISACCDVRLGVHDEVVGLAVLKKDVIKDVRHNNYVKT